MKLKSIVYLFFGLLIIGCGSSKNVRKQKKNPGTVQNEVKPPKLPSVNEVEITKKLAKNNPRLKKKTLSYVRTYAPIAVKQMHEYKIPASITLAQGILESGNGGSELALKSNNHFGIKCHTGWKGERVYHDDDAKGECFRKYQYIETSYEDHSLFLTQRRRYAFLFDYNIKDYKKWAYGLRKAGYATDRKYPAKLINLIKTYKLHEFDDIKDKNFTYQKPKSTQKIEATTKATSKLNNYKVQKGDTLYSISRKYGVSVAIIKKLNGLKDNTISIGQKLKLK